MFCMLYLKKRNHPQNFCRPPERKARGVQYQQLLGKQATRAPNSPLKHKPETAEVFILQILCAKHLTRGLIKLGAVESSPLKAADF